MTDEDSFYHTALLEWENGNRVDSIYAKAIAFSDGSDEKSKSLYVRFRAEQLQNARIETSKQDRKEKVKDVMQQMPNQIATEAKGCFSVLVAYAFLAGALVLAGASFFAYFADKESGLAFLYGVLAIAMWIVFYRLLKAAGIDPWD